MMQNPFLAGAGALLAIGYIYASGGPTPLHEPPEALMEGETIIYFGADNCGYCRQFEKKHEDKFYGRVERAGIEYERFVTDSIRDLNDHNVYGEYTSVYRAVVDEIGYLSVPAFAYFKDGELVKAKSGNWSPVLKAALN